MKNEDVSEIKAERHCGYNSIRWAMHHYVLLGGCFIIALTPVFKANLIKLSANLFCLMHTLYGIVIYILRERACALDKRVFDEEIDSSVYEPYLIIATIAVSLPAALVLMVLTHKECLKA